MDRGYSQKGASIARNHAGLQKKLAISSGYLYSAHTSLQLALRIELHLSLTPSDFSSFH
jgi:hypothetical protein